VRHRSCNHGTGRGWPLVPAVARRVGARRPTAPAQDPACARGCCPSSIGYPLAPGGGWRAPPCGSLRAWHGGDELQPRLQPWRSPALALAHHDPHQVAEFQELRPRGSVQCGNPAEVNNPNLKAVRPPQMDQAKVPTSGQISAWYPNNQPQHQQPAFQASATNYRFQSSSDGNFSHPEPPPHCAFGAPRMNIGINWV